MRMKRKRKTKMKKKIKKQQKIREGYVDGGRKETKERAKSICQFQGEWR